MNTRGKKSPLPPVAPVSTSSPPSTTPTTAPPPQSISPTASSTHSHASSHSSQRLREPREQLAAGDAAGQGLEDWRLEAVLASLLQLNDGKGRLLCPPFRVLPPRTELPLYYEQIKQPVDLKMIAQRLRDGGGCFGNFKNFNLYKIITPHPVTGTYLSSWQPMESDLKLLVRNAKAFNERGSQIYSDASRLQTHFMAKKDELSECRRLSAREMASHRQVIDDLLKQESSEEGGGKGSEYSEDSEEDEDSEQDTDPKWVLYWRVRNYEVLNGVALCEPFLELPSRREYPDYYDEVSF